MSQRTNTLTIRTPHQPPDLGSRASRIAANAILFAVISGPAACLITQAQEPQIKLLQGSDAVEVQAVASNIVRIHLLPNGQATPRTLVMDPSFQPVGAGKVRVEKDVDVQTFISPEMKVVVNTVTPFSVEVQDAGGTTLLTLTNNFGSGAGRGGGQRQRGGGAAIIHDENENIWGIKGLGLVAHTMFYVNEVRGAEEYATDTAGVIGKELDLAKKYIEALEEPFKPEEFTDSYREQLQALIASKEVPQAAAEAGKPKKPADKVVDIMAALRKSLETAQAANAQRKPPASEAAPERKPRKRKA